MYRDGSSDRWKEVNDEWESGAEERIEDGRATRNDGDGEVGNFQGGQQHWQGEWG